MDVFDSAVSGEYVETLEGHVITFPARSVRYVRDWVNGSTANAGNHWTEIQVWGWADVTHIGNYFEWVGNGTSGSTQTMLSYYYAGDQRVAMRRGKWTDPDTHGLIYLLGDHLGSASQAVDPIIDSFDNLPNVLTELRYTPWGKTRQTVGEMATDYRFTGQRWESGLGLYHYGARWYDPYITHFTQPDSIVPDPYNPLDWNRYSYARQNPVRYSDPTGHYVASNDGGLGKCKNSLDCVYPEGYANSGELIVRNRNKNDDPNWKKPMADILSYSALGFDATAALLADVEAIAVDIVAVSVIVPGCATIEGCLPAIALAYGIDWGVTTVSPLGTWENGLGVLSLLATGTADGLLGNTGPSDNGYMVGKDTIVAARNMAFGLVPEANFDAIVSNSQLKYDLDRLLGNKSGGSILINNPKDLFFQTFIWDWW